MIATLTSCAAKAPASVPTVDPDGWITVVADAPKSEPTCNRTAAQMVVLRQTLDAQHHKLELLDCNEAKDIADTRAKKAQDELKKANAFGKYGIPTIIGSVITSFIAGIVIGIEAKK